MTDPPNPVRAAKAQDSSRFEKVEMAKLRHETIADRLEAIRNAIAKLDGRIEHLDHTVRRLDSEVTRLSEQIRSHGQLLDRAHSDYDRVLRMLEAHDERLDVLERAEEYRRGRSALVASGAGVAGGGALVGIWEVLRRLLG